MKKTMTLKSIDSTFAVKKYLGLGKSATDRFRLIHVQECNNFVVDIAAIISRSQNKIQILAKLEKDLWAIRTSAKLLQSILLEITLNAIEAMPSCGKIIFQTRNIQLPDQLLRGSTKRIKWQSYVQILISDTGCGMTPKQKQNMFQANFTTKDTNQHTGNGLYFALSNLKMLKGSIQVYSCIGIGTVVKILIPAAKKIIPKPRQTVIERKKECSNRCVLIVDDETESTNIASHLLSRHGYQVKVASSATEGMINYKSFSKTIDLIMLDLTITGTEAYELLSFFWNIDPDQKIMVTVGVGEKWIYDKLVKHDFAGFIQKPYFPSSFVRTIKNAIDES